VDSISPLGEMISGRTQTMTTTPAPRLSGRWAYRAHGSARLWDEDVRVIRWWASTDGRGLSRAEQVRRLCCRYDLGRCAMTDLLSGESYRHVVGLPLVAWRWPSEQRVGLMMWLVWLLLSVRQSSQVSAHRRLVGDLQHGCALQ